MECFSEHAVIPKATPWCESHWYTCKLRGTLASQHIPRSAERLGLVIGQDAAVGVTAHGW